MVLDFQSSDRFGFDLLLYFLSEEVMGSLVVLFVALVLFYHIAEHLSFANDQIMIFEG